MATFPEVVPEVYVEAKPKSVGRITLLNTNMSVIHMNIYLYILTVS